MPMWCGARGAEGADPHLTLYVQVRAKILYALFPADANKFRHARPRRSVTAWLRVTVRAGLGLGFGCRLG